MTTEPQPLSLDWLIKQLYGIDTHGYEIGAFEKIADDMKDIRAAHDTLAKRVEAMEAKNVTWADMEAADGASEAKYRASAQNGSDDQALEAEAEPASQIASEPRAVRDPVSIVLEIAQSMLSNSDPAPAPIAEWNSAQYDRAIEREIEAELSRQVAKWGVQRHEPVLWNAILGEEVGEVSKAILETWYQGKSDTDDGLSYRKELIQVAAVAISAIRAFDMDRADGEAQS